MIWLNVTKKSIGNMLQYDHHLVFYHY